MPTPGRAGRRSAAGRGLQVSFLSLELWGLRPRSPPLPRCRAGAFPVLPQDSQERNPGHPWGAGGGRSRRPSAVGCPPPPAPGSAPAPKHSMGCGDRTGAAPSPTPGDSWQCQGTIHLPGNTAGVPPAALPALRSGTGSRCVSASLSTGCWSQRSGLR